eukprot:TRINITY_DN2081_c0_g1_i11.p1 TRINITY_DN2081_c0_g1~~TRINITY_DN2081_c0_g1_i11.p1  ORF type:complete len:508 (+),score=98.76 TRINITY_DN2081_c0_g1_i11:86-1525(+)
MGKRSFNENLKTTKKKTQKKQKKSKEEEKEEKDESIPIEIDDLPVSSSIPTFVPDVLSVIFSFIPFHESDWLNVKVICKSWLTVANQVFDPRQAKRRQQPGVMYPHESTLERMIVQENEAAVLSLLKDERVVRNRGHIDDASSYGMASVVRKLLEDDRFKSQDNNQALISACENGHLEVVKILLDHDSVNLMHIGRFDKYPLLSAIWNRHLEVVDFLLQHRKIDPTFLDNKPWKDAMHKIYRNQPIVVRMLQEERIRANVDFEALFDLCIKDNLGQILKEVLKSDKIDISERSDIIVTAVNLGHSGVVETLVDDGRFDPSMNDNELIRTASRNGFRKIVKKLLEDPRVDPSSHDNEALLQACELGHKAVIESLLKDARVDPSVNDNEALTQACGRGYEGIVEVLLDDERVDPSADNYSAIKTAMHRGRTDIASLILEHERVDPEEFDEEVIKTFEHYNLKLKGRKLVKQGTRARSTRRK